MSPRRRYAQNTSVPVVQTRLELETLLKRHNADGFGFMTEKGRAIVAFRISGLHVRLELKVPPEPSAKSQKEERRIWRAMLLIVKAKLEAIYSGVVEPEAEWMPYTVMPNGQTIGDWAKPQLEHMRKSGKIPPLLPTGSEALALPPPRRDP